MPTIATPAGAPFGYPAAPITPHQHGIAIRPHIELIGEAGPEAIILLKKAGGAFGHTIKVSAPITISGLAIFALQLEPHPHRQLFSRQP